MCWRDDIVAEPYCSDCGQTYYGGLGHRGCPACNIKPITPIVWEDPNKPWICDGCKDKPDVKTHKCEVERDSEPGQRR